MRCLNRSLICDMDCYKITKQHTLWRLIFKALYNKNFSRKPKICYNIQKSMPLDPLLFRINPFHPRPIYLRPIIY